MRIVLQKLFVVVCLDHKRVHFAQTLNQHLRRIPEVGDETQAAMSSMRASHAPSVTVRRPQMIPAGTTSVPGAAHAQTYESRLAVELAQLEYSLPRLKRMWTHLSRIKAGIGNPDPTTDNVLFYTDSANWPQRLYAQFTDPTVSFTRYGLIQLLGWRDHGESYRRLTRSLKCWTGVTLNYEKAWWDNKAKRKVIAP